MTEKCDCKEGECENKLTLKIKDIKIIENTEGKN